MPRARGCSWTSTRRQAPPSRSPAPMRNASTRPSECCRTCSRTRRGPSTRTATWRTTTRQAAWGWAWMRAGDTARRTGAAPWCPASRCPWAASTPPWRRWTATARARRGAPRACITRRRVCRCRRRRRRAAAAVACCRCRCRRPTIAAWRRRPVCTRCARWARAATCMCQLRRRHRRTGCRASRARARHTATAAPPNSGRVRMARCTRLRNETRRRRSQRRRAPTTTRRARSGGRQRRGLVWAH
mmetsp:Transcript_21923/g.67756  ORF Transcript_21923/g.67756 Transcript_21923/m.67756 type:complete len:244 (-) Transcript_21923:929-1660(-)